MRGKKKVFAGLRRLGCAIQLFENCVVRWLLGDVVGFPKTSLCAKTVGSGGSSGIGMI
jgi:hypothetical protein